MEKLIEKATDKEHNIVLSSIMELAQEPINVKIIGNVLLQHKNDDYLLPSVCHSDSVSEFTRILLSRRSHCTVSSVIKAKNAHKI